MGSWRASDTDALQLGARFSLPGGRALSIRVNAWLNSLRRERNDDFFEAWIAAQRVPPRHQF